MSPHAPADRPVGHLRVNGRPIPIHRDDTIASALHRAGVLTLARSRKFHRPRGLSGSFVAGHLATVDGAPHVRLDRTAASDGQRVETENVWPNGRFDLLRLARILPRRHLRAGFEHTNLVPSGTALFEPWERLMRFLAGEAEVPPAAGRSILPGRRLEADLAVVGGGPAGLGAANAAAARGEAVVLVCRGPAPGQSARDRGEAVPACDARITVLAAHEACGLYNEGTHLLCAPHDAALAATVVAARRVVLATGRRSVPPLVAGADLPGVMDAATALALANRHGVMPGERIAVIGSGSEAAVAERLRMLGAGVVATRPADAVRRVLGVHGVSGLDAGDHVTCDAVVHAGPWRTDRRLAFLAGAEGTLRLLGRDLPENVTLAGAAAEPDEPVSHGASLDRAALVCPCMDVTVDEILDLVAAGETHVEVLKRLTGCGMGPCQGVPCWDNLSHVVGHATGRAPAELGHPTYRPPGAALTLAQAAGLENLVPLS